MIYQKPIFFIVYIFVAIVVLFISYAFYLYFNQTKYVYYPIKNINATPKDIGLFYENLILNTSDGVKISAWYIPSDIPLEESTKNTKNSIKNNTAVSGHVKKNVTVLFFHGNGGNISYNLDFIEMFYNLGISTLIIDYRGYGKSEGKPDELGTYLDSDAAWDYLINEKNIKPSEIVIYGRSLGGPIAARLAKNKKPAALILDSTFVSIKDIAEKLYPYLPVRKFLKYEYNTAFYLQSVDCPVLIIHSIEDDYIPFTHAEKLYEIAPKESKLVKVKGDHNSNFFISYNTYKESISDLFNIIKYEKNMENEFFSK